MTDIDTTIVDEAVKAVTGDRPNAYGPPEDNFRNIAMVWAGILRARFGQEVDVDLLAKDSEIVALMMAGFKLARAGHKYGRDNYTDGHGYLLTGDRCARAMQEEAQQKAQPEPFAPAWWDEKEDDLGEPSEDERTLTEIANESDALVSERYQPPARRAYKCGDAACACMKEPEARVEHKRMPATWVSTGKNYRMTSVAWCETHDVWEDTETNLPRGPQD